MGMRIVAEKYRCSLYSSLARKAEDHQSEKHVAYRDADRLLFLAL